MMLRRLTIGLIAAVGVLVVVLAQTPSQIAAPNSGSHAIVLGVGSPVISAARSGTSIAIAAGDTVYLFDAGAGVVRRIFEAQPQLVAWKVRRFGPVFITHLHADHTLGLPELFFNHSNGPLVLYGPPGTAEMMNHIKAAFPPGPEFVAHVWGPSDTAYNDTNIKVKALGVEHKNSEVIGPAFGYRIETADRVFVVSGDTRPVDAIVEACNGCDILFHEVYDLEYPPGGPVYDPAHGWNANGHTSAAELGELARRAKPKLLVLYHTVMHGLGAGSDISQPAADAMVARVKQSFSGTVKYAHDLDAF